MTLPDDKPSEAVRAAAKRLQHLPPGPLAELRRMTEEAAAPEFWRLAARHPDTIGNRKQYAEWTAIVRILAILTEKGDPARRRPLHDRRRSLGEVLCDGGDHRWSPPGGGSPRPAFSEQRLAQLMAARGAQRAVLLTRAARALARSRDPSVGINVVDIAYAMLAPDNRRQLAEPYYRRLDRAELIAQESEEGTE